MSSFRIRHTPHSSIALLLTVSKTGFGSNPLRLLLMLLTAFALTFSLPAMPAFALQNSATGTASGVPLDVSGASVNLRLVGLNAVTSAIAEISPATVTSSSLGVRFSYDILPTITAGNSGVGTMTITAPQGYTNIASSLVMAGGVPLRANCTLTGAGEYCSAISDRTISITLGSPVTVNQTPIRVIFSADTPPAPGKGDFGSLVGGSQPNQSTAPGNADGIPGNANTLTVQVVPLDLKGATLTANPLVVVADGNAASKLTATVRNSSNQPLTGIPISFTSQRGMIDSITQ